jgi:hypothetical protein
MDASHHSELRQAAKTLSASRKPLLKKTRNLKLDK